MKQQAAEAAAAVQRDVMCVYVCVPVIYRHRFAHSHTWRIEYSGDDGHYYSA